MSSLKFLDELFLPRVQDAQFTDPIENTQFSTTIKVTPEVKYFIEVIASEDNCHYGGGVNWKRAINVEFATLKPTTKPKNCGNCNGASSGCCNTCYDVKVAYQLKNWAFIPSLIEQCASKPKKSSIRRIFGVEDEFFGLMCICAVCIIMAILIFIGVVYKLIHKSNRSSRFNVTIENLEMNSISISD